MERFDPDPSRPYQPHGGFLGIWLPRGRGRDDRAEGLLLSISVCANASYACTEAVLNAIPVDDRLAWAKNDRDGTKLAWRDAGERDPPVGHSLSLDFMVGVVTGARGGEVPAALAPFFRDPIPSWVLDDIFAEWASGRPQPPAVARPGPEGLASRRHAVGVLGLSGRPSRHVRSRREALRRGLRL